MLKIYFLFLHRTLNEIKRVARKDNDQIDHTDPKISGMDFDPSQIPLGKIMVYIYRVLYVTRRDAS